MNQMEPMEGTSDPPSSSPCPASKKLEGQAPQGGSPAKPLGSPWLSPPKQTNSGRKAGTAQSKLGATYNYASVCGCTAFSIYIHVGVTFTILESERFATNVAHREDRPRVA